MSTLKWQAEAKETAIYSTWDVAKGALARAVERGPHHARVRFAASACRADGCSSLSWAA